MEKKEKEEREQRIEAEKQRIQTLIEWDESDKIYTEEYNKAKQKLEELYNEMEYHAKTADKREQITLEKQQAIQLMEEMVSKKTMERLYEEIEYETGEY